MKKKNKEIIASIFVIILILIIVKLYQEKKLYEAYISIELFNELQSLTIAIDSSTVVYQEILDSGVVTKGNAFNLASYNVNIMMILQRLSANAYSFRRIKTPLPEGQHVTNSSIISAYFSNLQDSERIRLEELNEVLFEVDPTFRAKIEDLSSLNSLWKKSVERNVLGRRDVGLDHFEYVQIYGDNSISKEFWIKLIRDLENDTVTFLGSRDISSISEILDN